MLKALIKKQMMELYRSFFVDAKKGTARSKIGMVLYILLYGLLIIGVLGGAFTALSMVLCQTLHAVGMDWLYFALIGLVALILGVFSGAFTTNAAVYQAKDNDLLLSMPIPTRHVLTARLMGVYLMGLLFSAVVQLPAIVVYAVMVEPPVITVFFAVLQMVCISLIVLVLSCLLGWVVAQISNRMKNRNIIKVLASLVFLAVYYVVYFRAVNNFKVILEQATTWGKGLSHSNPLVILGAAAVEGKACLILTAVTAALLAVTLWIMGRSFLRLAVSSNNTTRSKAAKTQGVQVSSVSSALLKKELARFTSSSTYMLNTGLGLVLCLVAGVMVLIKQETLRGGFLPLLENVPEAATLAPIAVVVAVILLGGVNFISAPSVSLEGKSIWIPQSLPVKTWEVLYAKEKMEVLLNSLPCLFLAAALSIVLELETKELVLILAAVCVFVWFHAALGVVLNLWKPNLNWTNEMVPIKQGASSSIDMFGTWAIAAVIGAGAWFSRHLIPGDVYLTVIIVAFGLLTLVMHRWLKTKGAKIFAEL